MLTLPPTVRVYLAAGATDLRSSMDGLAALVASRLKQDPLSGHVFGFRNRSGNRLKLLVWDRSGYWVHYKRLEKGTFAWPKQGETVVEVRAVDLMLLLSGVDPARVRRRHWYDRAA